MDQPPGGASLAVHAYRVGAALEVEFTAGEERPVAVVTLGADAVCLVERPEILHVRRLVA